MQMVVSSEWLQTVSWEMKSLLDSSTEFMHAILLVLLGPVLGGPLDDADRWMMRWMSWCYETSWENVTQSLEANDRWIMKQGQGKITWESFTFQTLAASCLRFKMQLEISGKNMFSDSCCHQDLIHPKKDDLRRFTRSFHSPPLMSNETHQWFMRIQPMYPPQSDLHKK